MATFRRLLVLVMLLGIVLVSGSPLAPQVSAQAPVPPARASVSPAQTPAPATPTSPPSGILRMRRCASPAIPSPPWRTPPGHQSRRRRHRPASRPDRHPESHRRGGFSALPCRCRGPPFDQPRQIPQPGRGHKALRPEPAGIRRDARLLAAAGLHARRGVRQPPDADREGDAGAGGESLRLQIGDYQLGSRTFFANDQDPAVPASIAKNIQAVAGLSNLAQPQPNTQTTIIRKPVLVYIDATTARASSLVYDLLVASSVDFSVIVRRLSFIFPSVPLRPSLLPDVLGSSGCDVAPSVIPAASRHRAEDRPLGVRYLQHRRCERLSEPVLARASVHQPVEQGGRQRRRRLARPRRGGGPARH